MITTSFADLDSPERLRSILAERGYFLTEAPADKLFDLPPDQIGLMQGAQIVALAGPAPDDNTLVVIWVPRPSLPLDVLRRIRRRLAENTRDSLIFCAQSWQKATLYLLRQEDIPQPGQEPSVADRMPSWEVNFSALRPADRQGLAMLDVSEEDPYDLGKPLLRAFRRATRETIYQNQGLFSNYYLNERLEVDNESHNAAWRALATDMATLRPQIDTALTAGAVGLDLAQTEELIIYPLLQALGWQSTAKSMKGQVDLRLGGVTVAFCHMLPWGTPLDVAPLPGDLLAPPPPSPDMQLIGRLSGQKSVLWGILTNGRIWRLISRQATSTSGVFYEIDLQDLLEVGAPDDRDLRWFAAFFSADWLRAPGGQPGLLDVVYQSGQLWAEKLGQDLKKAIYNDVFIDLANALAEGVRRTGSEPHLPTVYRATLVLLYRLLFVLYAESRRLLPLTSPSYYPNSLTYMLSTLALKQHSLVAKEPVFSLQTDDPRLWVKLQALFQAIATGNPAWNIPHYNGGLFADDASPAHELLASLDGVANDYLTKGLDRLARDEVARGAKTENDVLRLIDYMDLDVQRLGSIYEGLLEFQLRRADKHGEVIDGQLTPVSAKKGRKNIGRLVQIGEVYLETTRQDRKASGSYYTPDYIVRYIVEQTIGPALEQRTVRFGEAMSRLLDARTQLRRAEQQIDNSRYDLQDYRDKQSRAATLEDAAVEALLDLKVLDPAMGSGHFLVAAVNFLSDQLIAILQLYPENPVLPRLAQVRAAIRKNLDEQGIPGAVVPDEQLSDRVLLRRMVMKRCIYGVDLNDMAVELAKLSLWLDSFAVGAPLSFLDHHLRWGNSLIGVWEVEKSIVQGSGRWNEFMRALGYMVQVTRLTDSTNAEVAESKALYKQAQAALRPFREQFNVDLAVHFATLGDIGRARQIAYQSTEDRAIWDDVTLAKFDMAQQEAENRHFFHWKLEFPEVFVDHEHSDWKANGAAGFDAVIGNPPFLSGRDIGDSKSKGFFRRQYKLSSYQADLYQLFMETGFLLIEQQGIHGFVVPDTWTQSVYSKNMRAHILGELSLLLIASLPSQAFEDAVVDTIVYIIRNKKTEDNTMTSFFKLAPNLITFTKLINQDSFLLDVDYRINLDVSDQQSIVLTKVDSVSQQVSEVLETTRGINAYDKARGQSADLIESRGYHASYQKDETYMPILMGEDVERLGIKWPGDHWISYGNWLAAPREPRFFAQQKVLVRKILNGSRIVSCVDVDGFYVDQQLYIGISRKGFELSLLYICAAISSQLLSFYYVNKYREKDLLFPQITVAAFEKFPLRRIYFTTPELDRKQLGNVVSAEAVALVENARELPISRGANIRPRYEADAYRLTTLGQRIATLLPQDAQGNFLAFANGATGAEEYSDVVHDLLAQLAEQMITLNKQKQAESKRFLGWLETQLDITTDKDGHKSIDSLANKTTLQNYQGDYQKNEEPQPWDSFFAVLYKNRRRFVNDYWVVGDMFRPQLKAEYEKSLATLLPIKERLARTDALIDQIVYQLYGLTVAEIAVVEGT